VARRCRVSVHRTAARPLRAAHAARGVQHGLDNNNNSNVQRAPVVGGGEGGATTTTTTEAPLHPHVSSLVLSHPLGPRSVPRNTNNNSKTDAAMLAELPNHGRVKRLVLQHLACAAATGDDGGEQLAAVEGGGGERRMEMDMVVDNLLSRLPYKKMLSDMFGGTLRGTLQNSNIPYATRAYEESFMREVQNAGERECARGPQCECMFIDRQHAFVGVEFLLPSEQRPPTPHLCVLCCRAITQQLYYDVMFDKAEFQGVIQRFGNIHSEPGEYALDAMLIAAPTAPVHVMPLPIVSHQRNRYEVFVQGGIKRLRQTRVYFQSTPSCNAGSG
jgi:hypothetical protein